MGLPIVAIGDLALNLYDTHGNDCCPHVVIGPVIAGSPKHFTGGKNVGRIGDLGIHSWCCGANMFVIRGGSATVRSLGEGVSRIFDATDHCGGTGMLITGRPTARSG